MQLLSLHHHHRGWREREPRLVKQNGALQSLQKMPLQAKTPHRSRGNPADPPATPATPAHCGVIIDYKRAYRTDSRLKSAFMRALPAGVFPHDNHRSQAKVPANTPTKPHRNGLPGPIFSPSGDRRAPNRVHQDRAGRIGPPRVAHEMGCRPHWLSSMKLLACPIHPGRTALAAAGTDRLRASPNSGGERMARSRIRGLTGRALAHAGARPIAAALTQRRST